MIEKSIKWVLSIFEDQAGSASSKRFVLFICVFFFGMMVKGSLDAKPINTDILTYDVGIILFCVGAVTSEFFKKP